MSDETEIQHFDSSVVKIDKDGNRVLSTTLYPGEVLESELEAQNEEESGDVDGSDDSSGDSSNATAGGAKTASNESETETASKAE